MVTVLLFRGTHALALTWALASSAYLSPWICSQRDFADSAWLAWKVTVLLTVVPFSPKTSIGNRTRSVVGSARPAEIAAKDRQAIAQRRRASHLPIELAVPCGPRPDKPLGPTTLLGCGVLSACDAPLPDIFT